MGMFDWVNVPPMPCPFCGEENSLRNWQTKDSDCLLNTVEYWTVDNFYTSCDECDAWVEFSRHIPREKPTTPLAGFELVRPKCERCGDTGWITGDPVAGVSGEPCGCDEDWSEAETVDAAQEP